MYTQIKEDSELTAEEQKNQLFLRQKELLETFLEHGAITQQQHDKSLRALTEKMRCHNNSIRNSQNERENYDRSEKLG